MIINPPNTNSGRLIDIAVVVVHVHVGIHPSNTKDPKEYLSKYNVGVVNCCHITN